MQPSITLRAADHRDHYPVSTIGINAAGEVYAAWRLWECLDAQFEDGGDTYLLRNGEFHAVDPSYLGTLNSRLGDIDESTISLPNSRRVVGPDGTAKEIDEGTYNQEAADSSPDFLCLDKKTVRAEGHTSPIEVCDVVSSDRRLIHVKRKFSSSALSHLFSQGLVSSQLLMGSADFKTTFVRRSRTTHFGTCLPSPSRQATLRSSMGSWATGPAELSLIYRSFQKSTFPGQHTNCERWATE